MKAERGGLRTPRHEQVLKSPAKDAYRETEKLAEATRCPKCDASYHKGRWTWRKAPAGAALHKCPACRRIEDDFAGGYVTLKGDFLKDHRNEILSLVSAREARAREEHPLQRIIHVKPGEKGGVVITTTEPHLARGIAEAVHEAFKGALKIDYSKDEYLVRAMWSRQR